MINPQELRLGNSILFKKNGRVMQTRCAYEHFALMERDNKDVYPVLLKPEIFLQNGFIENKEYALAPQAREFKLILPVIGNNENTIMGYMKNNGECFCRAMLNGMVISNNLFHLHQLQNLYYFLSGNELGVQ